MALIFVIYLSLLWINVLGNTTTITTTETEMSTTTGTQLNVASSSTETSTAGNTFITSLTETWPTGSTEFTSSGDSKTTGIIENVSSKGQITSSKETASPSSSETVSLSETLASNISKSTSFTGVSTSSKLTGNTPTTPPTESTRHGRVTSGENGISQTGAKSTDTVTDSGSDVVTTTKHASVTVSRVMTSATRTTTSGSNADSSKGLPSWAYMAFIVAALLIFVPLLTYGVIRCRKERYPRHKRTITGTGKPKQSSNDNLHVTQVNSAYDGKSVATYRPEIDNAVIGSAAVFDAHPVNSKYLYYRTPENAFPLSDFYHFNRAPYMSLSGRPPNRIDPTRGNYTKLN